jgi:hypothetical protein
VCTTKFVTPEGDDHVGGDLNGEVVGVVMMMVKRICRPLN